MRSKAHCAWAEYAKRAGMQSCRAYRLTIRSTLEIPGALPVEDDAGLADISIFEAPVVAQGKQFGPYTLRDDGRLVFEMAGVARYLCDEESVAIERLDGADDAAVAGYLIATALPAVLWMRGEIVLHTAAAMLPGAAGAFAVMGASGSGKSTVLRALIAMGARIVADDTVCVRQGSTGVEVSGLAGGYFHGDPRIFHAVERGLDSAPLAGIALLEMPRADGSSEIRQLPRLEALTTLIGNRHRPRVPALLGLQARLMVPLAELAGALPMHGWKRREGASVLDPEEIALLGGLA